MFEDEFKPHRPAHVSEYRVYVRSWGDVVSIELEIQDKNVFSFQIAQRSAQLRPSTLAPWTSVLLDSLHDLIAGKMTALVERGAPRDFRDIFAICQAGMTTPAQCWELWHERQQAAERLRIWFKEELISALLD